MNRTTVIASLLLCVVTVSAQVDPSDEGMAACERGDHAAAEHFRTATEQGVADARFNLAVLFETTEGVSEETRPRPPGTSRVTSYSIVGPVLPRPD